MTKRINKDLLWILFYILLSSLITTGLIIGFGNQIRIWNLSIDLFTLTLFLIVILYFGFLIKEYRYKYKRYLHIQLVVNTFTLLVTSIYTYLAFSILFYASIFSAEVTLNVIQFLTGVLISLILLIFECVIIIRLIKKGKKTVANMV
jgi:hypothetical protein